MAKIYGLFGTMTGKLADTVMSVRNGEQIARKYQPVVFNPSTPAQVASRAKLKLASQLSAVMAPVIAIPRVGSVSTRNQFVKVNYPAISYSEDQAQIDFSAVKLTKSIVGLYAIAATRSGADVSVSLGAPMSSIDQMVYVVFAKNSDNTLRYIGSSVVSEAGTNNLFPGIIDVTGLATSATLIAYGYGVKHLSESAKAVYGDMIASTAEDFAKLITSRNLSEADVQLTETRFAEVTSTNP